MTLLERIEARRDTATCGRRVGLGKCNRPASHDGMCRIESRGTRAEWRNRLTARDLTAEIYSV